MNNLTAARNLCNAICNSFYPDVQTVELVLFNNGVDPQADATPKDPQIFRVAVALVRGYVESSRSEGGISVSVMSDAVEDSLAWWCDEYGLDAEEELGDLIRTIKNGSNIW